MSNELIHELEEDIKRDRALTLWKKYSDWIIGASVGIVLATAGNAIWKHYQVERNERLTGDLVRGVVMLEKKKDEGEKVLQDLAKQESSSGPTATAALRLAAHHLKNDEGKKALELYRTVASDSKADPALQQIAQLLAAHVAIRYGLEYEGPAKTDTGAALGFSLKEAEGWKRYHDGKREEAAAIFKALKEDVTAPPPLRQRMQMVLSYLAPDRIEAGHEDSAAEE